MNHSWRTDLAPEGAVKESEKINILLVSVDASQKVTRTPMLAPAILVAHSRRDPFIRNRVQFDIRQFFMGEPVECIIADILTKKYHAIGFSCYVWNYSVYEQIIPVLKQIQPETIMIMGGPQILEQEHNVLEQIPSLDIVVYDNGEAAFADIVRQIACGQYDWTKVGGILCRTNRGIVDTYSQMKPVKFADVASPYLEGVITGHHPNLFLMTYRGCPQRCAFCSWCGKQGNQIEMLPLERLQKELDLIRDMGTNSIGIFDSNFNQPPSRAQKIFDMIHENQQINLLGTSIYAQSLDETTARKLGRLKSLIGVGLQSTDPQTNEMMKRPFAVDKMAAGLRLMEQYELQFTLQTIVGLPGDTYDSIAATLNYAMKFRPVKIDTFRLMILPGTGYRRMAEEFKIVYEPHPYYHIISHCTMNPAEINHAERMAQALSLFYNLPTTRKEMFTMAMENRETVIDFSDALGVFIDNFDLLDREYMRDGALMKVDDERYLLKILDDFQRFRNELRGKNRQQNRK